MSAIETVTAEIVKRGRAQGYELAPWFEANQSRLRVFSNGLERILSRLPLSEDSDQKRALTAHAQLRAAIAPLRPPEEIAWFDRNRPILLSISATISGQQRAIAALERAGAAPSARVWQEAIESFELRSAADRTAANIAAVQPGAVGAV